MSADILRAIVDADAYMTLATADAEGRPRVTTVWFAPVDYREFLWVSDPGTTHSRNVAVRPEVSIVIARTSRRRHAAGSTARSSRSTTSTTSTTGAGRWTCDRGTEGES